MVQTCLPIDVELVQCGQEPPAFKQCFFGWSNSAAPTVDTDGAAAASQGGGSAPPVARYAADNEGFLGEALGEATSEDESEEAKDGE